MPTILEMPKFNNESEEADWWASAAGRNYVEIKSKLAQAKGIKPAGSTLVARLARDKQRPVRPSHPR